MSEKNQRSFIEKTMGEKMKKCYLVNNRTLEIKELNVTRETAIYYWYLSEHNGKEYRAQKMTRFDSFFSSWESAQDWRLSKAKEKKSSLENELSRITQLIESIKPTKKNS